VPNGLAADLSLKKALPSTILGPRRLPEYSVPDIDADSLQPVGGPYRLLLDAERFSELRRPTLYALTNTIVSMLSNMGRAWGLRPAELQIFLIIGTASLQRFVRLKPPPLEHSGDTPLPTPFRSGISRRQIAELTGLSRESIRRTVLRLMERGLVVEPARGLLVHPQGMMQWGSGIFSPEEMLQPYIAMFDQLIRVGVVRVRDA
jgi:hypothetical protein